MPSIPIGVQEDASPIATQAEAAEFLRCTERNVRRLIASGQLPAYKVGTSRSVRIRRDDLNALLQPMAAGGAE